MILRAIPKYLLFALLLPFLMTSCKESPLKGTGKILAKAQDHYLYASDLKGLVPAGTSKKDSIEIAKNFIHDWIRQKLVIIQAEQNLPKSQKDFSKELDEYRNSLLVYRYESKLISEKLDTNITSQQIEDYYNLNKDNFELKDNIVKVLYVKLALKDPNLGKIRPLIKSGNDQDKKRLETICASSAVNYYLDDKSWLLFNDLLKEIPIKTYDQEAYLQNHRFIEMTDDDFTYLLNIREFEIKEGVSPLSFETDNIRNILINKRKMMLIENLEKDAFQKAEKNKEFEIY